MFNTPILYIVFNRLDTVKQTFPQIKKQQPKDLYVAADGPRPSKPEESEKCKAVRDWILSQIDWDCNVHTLFREKNLGCKYGVAGAIKWFFENVEQGIVIEDDIFPAQSFFKFCEQMLEIYKDRNDIGFISGCCAFPALCKKNTDYFLSTIPGVWGWASWKRAVKDYSPDIASLLENIPKRIKTIILDKRAEKALLDYSKLAVKNEIDTWDYQMVDYMTSRGFYTIYPCKSLVRNIGFISDSTHTSTRPYWYTDTLYERELKPQEQIFLNKKYANTIEKEFYTSFSILKAIKGKLYSVYCLWDELYRSIIRLLDGEIGQKLRYKYYKKRLKHLGKNVIIDTGVFITGAKYISIGDNTHIDKNCILVGSSSNLNLSHRILVERSNEDFKRDKGSITIGKECHISQNVMIYGYGGVDIGDYVAISADTKIYSLTSLPFNPYNRNEVVSTLPYSGRSPTFMGPVVMGNNSWLGIGCIVQPCVSIASNTFVESYSIISSPLEENIIARGNPATLVRKRFKTNGNQRT